MPLRHDMCRRTAPEPATHQKILFNCQRTQPFGPPERLLYQISSKFRLKKWKWLETLEMLIF